MVGGSSGRGYKERNGGDDEEKKRREEVYIYISGGDGGEEDTMSVRQKEQCNGADDEGDDRGVLRTEKGRVAIV